MVLPPSFKIPGCEGKVRKLKTALYGLKQSPRAWFKRFNGNLKGLDTDNPRLIIPYLISITGTTTVIVC